MTYSQINDFLIDILCGFIYNWLCGVKGDFFEMEFTMDCETKGWMF